MRKILCKLGFHKWEKSKYQFQVLNVGIYGGRDVTYICDCCGKMKVTVEAP